MLSPALFTLYTLDCRCKEEGVLQIKFSDDTSISGLISKQEEDSYRGAVERMVSWCDDNFLLLNVKKTKELIVDFRRKPHPLAPLKIKGEEVEVVEQYKYLGSIIDRKLNWADNTTALVGKGQQRLHFLRKLRSFNVCPKILELFYTSTVQSVLTFNSLGHFGSLREVDLGRLTKLTRTATDVIGSPVTDLQAHFDRKALQRLLSILGDSSHPLHEEAEASRTNRVSAGRLRSIKTRTERFRRSFLPNAVRLYNLDS